MPPARNEAKSLENARVLFPEMADTRDVVRFITEAYDAPMDRRYFLSLAAASTASLLLDRFTPAQEPQQPSPPARKRPNFLFIYMDDQRFDAMGCVQQDMGDRARFPWFNTPNMDRLARQGVRFRNAFCTNSLCSPSRATYLTGLYNHFNGVANNHTPLPLDIDNYAKRLRAAGYTTGYFGKWHMDKQEERPGFDVIYSFLAHGWYWNCPFNINGAMTDTTGWVDDVTTDFALSFLLEHDKNKPFAMVIGWKSPHVPRLPPPRTQHSFAGDSGRAVPNFDAPTPYPPVEYAYDPHKPWAEHDRDYFRVISAADQCLGRILDALDELKLTDDTIVVWTSDHGYYLGEHGIFDKRAAYEEGMRIPFLIRYPGVIPADKTVDEMVLNLDWAPTVLDYAGVPIPEQWQGRSWKPLLAGNAANWRTAFFYEYFWERNYHTPTITAVRTKKAKLIKYPDHESWNELFDLENDPYETKNLYGTQPQLQRQMEQIYDQQAAAVKFHIPEYADRQA